MKWKTKRFCYDGQLRGQQGIRFNKCASFRYQSQDLHIPLSSQFLKLNSSIEYGFKPNDDNLFYRLKFTTTLSSQNYNSCLPVLASSVASKISSESEPKDIVDVTCQQRKLIKKNKAHQTYFFLRIIRYRTPVLIIFKFFRIW